MATSLLLSATLAGAGSFCPIAAAQGGGDPSKLALAAGYEADRLFASGKWTEAYDKFKEADRLAHSPVFVLYMARAKRNDGKLVEASEIYATVANEKVDPKAPKPFLSAVKDAAAELEELRARIPAARVEVKNADPRDLEITIDGKPARTGARILLDPGPHDFVAKRGEKHVDKTVTLAEGGSETVVELAFEEAKKVPAAKAKKQGGFVPGAILLAFGGAGVDLGIVTGVIAAVQSSKIKEGCVDTHCLATDADALDRARLLGNVSTGALVAGGLVAVTGIVLLVVRPGGADPAKPHATIGPGFVSVGAAF